MERRSSAQPSVCEDEFHQNLADGDDDLTHQHRPFPPQSAACLTVPHARPDVKRCAPGLRRRGSAGHRPKLQRHRARPPVPRNAAWRRLPGGPVPAILTWTMRPSASRTCTSITSPRYSTTSTVPAQQGRVGRAGGKVFGPHAEGSVPRHSPPSTVAGRTETGVAGAALGEDRAQAVAIRLEPGRAACSLQGIR